MPEHRFLHERLVPLRHRLRHLVPHVAHARLLCRRLAEQPQRLQHDPAQAPVDDERQRRNPAHVEEHALAVGTLELRCVRHGDGHRDAHGAAQPAERHEGRLRRRKPVPEQPQHREEDSDDDAARHVHRRVVQQQQQPVASADVAALAKRHAQDCPRQKENQRVPHPLQPLPNVVQRVDIVNIWPSIRCHYSPSANDGENARSTSFLLRAHHPCVRDEEEDGCFDDAVLASHDPEEPDEGDGCPDGRARDCHLREKLNRLERRV
mmetsp:Transcript_31344/g.102223  ORF Transcript_31344/g.102223 Transcript_31344/m.102223 type:complete len:264 (+) Transcript_31344:906-1697(+)